MSERSSLITSRSTLSVLGFGFSRSLTARPEFTPAELWRELKDTPNAVARTTLHSRSSILANNGYLMRGDETERVTPGSGPNPNVNYSITELGIDSFFASVEYYVRNKGETLPSLLLAQSCVEAVVEDGRVMEAITAQIIGAVVRLDATSE